jgi:hypothetical protein
VNSASPKLALRFRGAGSTSLTQPFPSRLGLSLRFPARFYSPPSVSATYQCARVHPHYYLLEAFVSKRSFARPQRLFSFENHRGEVKAPDLSLRRNSELFFQPVRVGDFTPLVRVLRGRNSPVDPAVVSNPPLLAGLAKTESMKLRHQVGTEGPRLARLKALRLFGLL